METVTQEAISFYEIANILRMETNMQMKSRMVLVVDDVSLNQRIAKTYLNDMGYKVDIAETGEEALNLFFTHDYDLILMDLGLPDIKGEAVTKRIRNLEEGTGKHIPIIAATAYGVSRYQACIDAGMDDFLQKPLMLNDLKAMMDKYAPLIDTDKKTN